jgi:hypothetical protein
MKTLISLAVCLFLVGLTARADDAAKGDAKGDAKAAAPAADKADTKAADAKDAAGGEKKAVAEGTVTCKSGNDERTISSTKGEGGAGCQVMYKKGGEEKSVADAKNDTSYCEKVVDKIKKNLTAAGYTCE